MFLIKHGAKSGRHIHVHRQSVLCKTSRLLFDMQNHQFILLDLQDTVHAHYINTYLTFTHAKIVLDLHQFY